MVVIKTPEEVELIRESSLLVGKTLATLAKLIKPGATGNKLDKVAEEFIRSHGDAVPGFKGLYGCPSTLLVSVNQQVVHGLPSDKPFKEGDIISVDCGVYKNGFYGDSAFTFPVGEIKADVRKLLRVTYECLYKGIEMVKPGNRVGDVSFAVQSHAEANGYSVVRELVGHGLGRSLHEKPEVPNFGKRGSGPALKEGMTIAIEPMINMGKARVITEEDGWTVRAADNLPSAHYEHSVAVTKNGVEILSSFDGLEDIIKYINS